MFSAVCCSSDEYFTHLRSCGNLRVEVTAGLSVKRKFVSWFVHSVLIHLQAVMEVECAAGGVDESAQP